MKGAIGYVRVSTRDQATDGVSLGAQRARIEAWCTAHDYELVACRRDEGISGATLRRRPGAQRALDEACDGGLVLVVYSLSRLSRSLADTLTIAERLGRSGAELVSLSENLDTTSAAGRMVFKILAVFAEFEREIGGERTAAALARKRALGESTGPAPYGWRAVGEPGPGRKIEADPGQQCVLAKMERWRRGGRSFGWIARRLADLGHPTAQGRAVWSPRTVQKVLLRAATRAAEERAAAGAAEVAR